MEIKNLKFIDLFCGIGGFHLALNSYGAECVFSCDVDESAIKVYENNFKAKVYRDITKVDIKNDIPQHDIICAGFPCQAFSISGKMQGFDDYKERGELYKYIVKIAEHHKPKIVLLENVKNLETHNSGKSLKRIKKEFENIGYYFYYKSLNASDFGIPQARKRLYMLAFRKELNIKEFSFPSGSKNSVCVKDILEKKADRKQTKVDRTDVKIIKNNKEKKNELIRIGHIGKGRQGERIYSVLGHATTLSSQGGGVGGKTGMYQIDGEIHKLTGRECARLMGFPDSYKIAETNNLCYTQFGNSLVVNVLKEILKVIERM